MATNDARQEPERGRSHNQGACAHGEGPRSRSAPRESGHDRDGPRSPEPCEELSRTLAAERVGQSGKERQRDETIDVVGSQRDGANRDIEAAGRDEHERVAGSDRADRTDELHRGNR